MPAKHFEQVGTRQQENGKVVERKKKNYLAETFHRERWQYRKVIVSWWMSKRGPPSNVQFVRMLRGSPLCEKLSGQTVPQCSNNVSQCAIAWIWGISPLIFSLKDSQNLAKPLHIRGMDKKNKTTTLNACDLQPLGWHYIKNQHDYYVSTFKILVGNH